MSHKWNHSLWYFWGLASYSQNNSLDSFRLLYVSIILSFLSLSSIPQYGYTSLSNHSPNEDPGMCPDQELNQ